jgi:4'-phosphopantetheinyl transferase
VHALGRSSRQEVHSIFFDLWTRKEAVLKAAGSGFSIDPRQVEVGIGPGRKLLNLNGQTWTVASLAISPIVAAATAIEGNYDASPVVNTFEQTNLDQPTADGRAINSAKFLVAQKDNQ